MMTTEQLLAKIRELLPDNEEVKEFTDNRKKKIGQRYIPTYHFSSPGEYLNDPNGYIYYKGVYHLFYQFIPETNRCNGWGHAVSVDRFHWLDLPMALRPTDEEYVFSGNTMVDGDRVVACYPGEHPNRKGTAVYLAESTDDLLINWSKLPQSPVYSTYNEDGSCNSYVAFDPYMWKQNGRYYIVSADGGALPLDQENPNWWNYRKPQLFTSEDLITWKYLHPILEDDRFSALGDDGACPYLLPAGNGKHVLFHFSHMSGGMYVVGTLDETAMKFHAEDGGAFNRNGFYSGIHAPSAYADPDGTMHLIFNINYGKRDLLNNQIMSLPLQYKLLADNTLCVEPDGAYQALRYDHVHMETHVIPANKEIVLENISGDALELEITADVAEKSQSSDVFMPSNLLPMLEIRVLRSPDAEEYTAIRFFRNRSKNNWDKFRTLPGWIDAANSVVEVDTSHSTLAADVAVHPTESQEYYLGPDEPVKLHIFVDKSIVEVFAGDKKYMAVRTYPTREDSIGVSILSRGVAAEIACDAWKMKP